ncbi:hypothetical protein [Methylobacterium sp. E-046]|uniref:hypothetical protein n=1 Tax=Methylobacterium sp. E-046 TaxID=2836576 RepID=UPI001FB8FAC1|nr:hypothetical protein [Methylobacterium sp. E-046]MCJ2102421.1 hypothetical protein [Methylobacterium sp. E-046]
MIAHVRQEEAFGCAVACCAMIQGVSYAKARASFGPPGRGFTRDVWQEYLARHGFAVRHLHRIDHLARVEREVWPLSPWADVHLCSVDAGHGMGSHLVVLLRDGTVLDPATDAPRRLADYASVAYMAAVYAIGCGSMRDWAQRTGLIADEVAALEGLTAAWSAFLRLPQDHPDEVGEFRRGLHILQDQVLARPTRRASVELRPTDLPPTPPASPGPDA